MIIFLISLLNTYLLSSYGDEGIPIFSPPPLLIFPSLSFLVSSFLPPSLLRSILPLRPKIV